jgi:hypothetical protein
MPYFISLFTGAVQASSVMKCVFCDKMMRDLMPLVENGSGVIAK